MAGAPVVTADHALRSRIELAARDARREAFLEAAELALATPDRVAWRSNWPKNVRTPTPSQRIALARDLIRAGRS